MNFKQRAIDNSTRRSVKYDSDSERNTAKTEAYYGAYWGFRDAIEELRARAETDDSVHSFDVMADWLESQLYQE